MNIKWYFLNYDNLPTNGSPPEPAFKNIIKTFDNNSEVLICPAVGNYFKNTWIIKSPVDIEYQYFNNILTTNSKYVTSRPHKDRDILTFPLRYVFVSKESVVLESFPAFMFNTEAQTKLRMIPGSFNIGKWIRPVDFTAQSLTSDVVKINKGDPLFCIRLLTDEKVELEQVTDQNEIKK